LVSSRIPCILSCTRRSCTLVQARGKTRAQSGISVG
jgi:hypothetical protein